MTGLLRHALFALLTAGATCAASCVSSPTIERDAHAAPKAVAHADTTAPSPSPAPTHADAKPSVSAESPAQWIDLTPRVRANRADKSVEFDAVTVLNEGFLEQIVCLVGTREHEAVFAFEGRASDIHAALLFAGFEPGAPGSWRRETDGATGAQRIVTVAPSGAELRIEVGVSDGGRTTWSPIDRFVRVSPIATGDAGRPVREFRFVFAGSRLRRNQRTGEELYVADGSGSLVGLVTFGDETIGAMTVIPDEVDAAEPIWEAATDQIPQVGTKVVIRISSASRADAQRPPPAERSTTSS